MGSLSPLATYQPVKTQLGLIQSSAEAQSQNAFLALMWSLSYPDSQFALPSEGSAADSLLVIGRALLDLETSYHAPESQLAAQLAKTSASAQPITHANYVFFSQMDVSDLSKVAQLKTGDFNYPDNSATLIVACEFDGRDSTALCLSGPGILEPRTIRLSGLPDGLWDVRRNLVHYPLGIDMVLVSHGWVIGLPRTTQVTRCM